ncbi:MAG: hypothetical protein K8H86_08055 [Ignavibacteriaceae bacterium]|nr:hypothetical protein [Ignavibacteriaceae bacterium]
MFMGLEQLVDRETNEMQRSEVRAKRNVERNGGNRLQALVKKMAFYRKRSVVQ